MDVKASKSTAQIVKKEGINPMVNMPESVKLREVRGFAREPQWSSKCVAHLVYMSNVSRESIFAHMCAYTLRSERFTQK